MPLSEKKRKSADNKKDGSVTTKSSSKEKRAKRYRSTCPGKLLDRISRASTQRLYLVEKTDVPNIDICKPHELSIDFSVLGSTGNLYKVTLSHIPTCNCPDFCRNQDLCKHMLFVLLKVIGLKTSDPLAYQKAYITSELHQLFDLIRNRRVGGSVLANAQVRAAVSGGTPQSKENIESSSNNRKSVEDDDDCPICFDALKGSAKLTFCRAACGSNFHTDCIRRWLANSRDCKSCPNCRQPWQDEEQDSTKKPRKSEGYDNYGDLQGQSSVRDTSTYYSPPSFRYKGRW